MPSLFRWSFPQRDDRKGRPYAAGRMTAQFKQKRQPSITMSLPRSLCSLAMTSRTGSAYYVTKMNVGDGLRAVPFHWAVIGERHKGRSLQKHMKNPPFPEKRGISSYILFVPIHSRITRSLLVCRQVPCRTVWLSALPTYSWGPAATRALPSSLPVYLAKFLMKRADRSLAFSSQTPASA